MRCCSRRGSGTRAAARWRPPPPLVLRHPSSISLCPWRPPSSPGCALQLPANTSSVSLSPPASSFLLTTSRLSHRHSLLGPSSLPPLSLPSCLPSSTHLQVANWGLPLAAIADLSKDEEVISGAMTTALASYSSVLLLFSVARSHHFSTQPGLHALRSVSPLPALLPSPVFLSVRSLQHGASSLGTTFCSPVTRQTPLPN